MIESEIIIEFIIQKLISYTITNITRIEIAKRLNPFYNEFIKTLMKDTLNLQIISHDYELSQSTNPDQINQDVDNNDHIFFENRIYGFNDWSLMSQPSSSRIDRAASTSIKFFKSTKVNTSLKPQSLEKKPPTMKNTSLMKDEFDVSSRIKKKTDTKKEETKQVDLENIQVYMEPPEISEVRKKKEDEWKKKEEDAKKKIMKDRERQEENNEYIKKQKDFEKKNVTADSNGCPIIIKGISSGLVNDFILAKHGINDKEILSIVKTEKSEGKKEEKMISATLVVPPKDVPVVTNKKEDKKKTGPIQEKLPVKAEVKENMKKIVIFENNSNVQKQPINIITQPAGSNYDYFVPSVGVTISEGTKNKTGGKNFYSIFSKPSVYDYRQLVRDSAQTQYGSSFLQNSEFPKNENIDKMAQTANQLSLPQLMKNTFKEDKQSTIKSKMDSMKVSNKIASLRSVLDALDQMPEYEQKLEDEHFRSTNTDIFKNKKNLVEKEKDIFKESMTASLEEINKFNHSIMRNNLWGQNLLNKPKPNTANKLPIKPDTKELEREMGKTIVNTKLPRSRHLTKLDKMKK